MYKALTLLFGLATVLLAILYVSRGKAATREEAAAAASGEEYVFIGVSVSNAYWIDSQAGVRDAGRDLGVKATFTGPEDNNVEKQVPIIESAITRGVRGIVVCPAEPNAVVGAIDRAIAAGIPVLTVDTDAPKSRRYTFVGTDNYQAGLLGGKLLAEQIGGQGEVALLTIPAQWNLQERCRGYEDALKAFPGIKIVTTADDGAKEEQAAAAAKRILASNPKLAGFGCVDAAGGAGAAVAVREANKKGSVKIVAMDRNDGTLNFIKEGYIQASLAQRTYTMSYLALRMLFDLNHNRIRMVNDWRKAATCPLPALVDTGTVVITPENVEFFYH